MVVLYVCSVCGISWKRLRFWSCVGLRICEYGGGLVFMFWKIVLSDGRLWAIGADGWSVGFALSHIPI